MQDLDSAVYNTFTFTFTFTFTRIFARKHFYRRLINSSSSTRCFNVITDREGGPRHFAIIHTICTSSDSISMAAMNLDGPSPFPDFGPVYESDVEAELEVDQLDSDSDNDDTADPTKANSTSTNGTGRAGERVPGHTLLSAVRIENMIQADGLRIPSPCQDHP